MAQRKAVEDPVMVSINHNMTVRRRREIEHGEAIGRKIRGWLGLEPGRKENEKGKHIPSTDTDFYTRTPI